MKDPYCATILSIERKQMTAEILWSIQHNPTKYGFQTVDFYGVTNHHTAVPIRAGWKLSVFSMINTSLEVLGELDHHISPSFVILFFTTFFFLFSLPYTNAEHLRRKTLQTLVHHVRG